MLNCSDGGNDTPVNNRRTAISRPCPANTQSRFRQWQDGAVPSPLPAVSRRRMLLGTAALAALGVIRRRVRQAAAASRPRRPGVAARPGPQRQPAGNRRRNDRHASAAARADHRRVRTVGPCAGALRRDRPPHRRGHHVGDARLQRRARRRRPRRPPRTSSPRCASPPTAQASWRPRCPATAPGCSVPSPHRARRPTPWHWPRRR